MPVPVPVLVPLPVGVTAGVTDGLAPEATPEGLAPETALEGLTLLLTLDSAKTPPEGVGEASDPPTVTLEIESAFFAHILRFSGTAVAGPSETGP